MSQLLIRRIAYANSLTCLILFLVAASAALAQVAYVQQSLQPSNRWQLGVKVQNTSTGVVLTYVQPGSVAANAGLSVGDRILAIGGHQVGYVDGQLIDPVDEINQHIDPAGQVTMLVLTTSHGLLAGSLSLTTAGSVVQGMATFQGRVNVSPQGVFNVRLLDITHNWNGVVVAQTSLPRPNANPYYFQVAYNPNQIYNGHRYAIAAEVIDRGQIAYRTPQPVQITLNSGQVAITLLAANTNTVVAMPYQQINGWYDRSQNDPDLYLRNVFRDLHGTDPTPQELNVLRQQYNQMNGVRTQFVQQMQSASPQ